MKNKKLIKAAEAAKKAGYEVVYSLVKIEKGVRLYHLVILETVIKFRRWFPASVQIIPDSNGSSGVKVYKEIPEKSISMTEMLRRFGR